MREWALNSKNKSLFLFIYDKWFENKSINTYKIDKCEPFLVALIEKFKCHFLLIALVKDK